jgi:hypothetical protein
MEDGGTVVPKSQRSKGSLEDGGTVVSNSQRSKGSLRASTRWSLSRNGPMDNKQTPRSVRYNDLVARQRLRRVPHGRAVLEAARVNLVNNAFFPPLVLRLSVSFCNSEDYLQIVAGRCMILRLCTYSLLLLYRIEADHQRRREVRINRMKCSFSRLESNIRKNAVAQGYAKRTGPPKEAGSLLLYRSFPKSSANCFSISREENSPLKSSKPRYPSYPTARKSSTTWRQGTMP